MLLFTNKKKNIFSKRSDVIKNELNVSAEYLKRIEIRDEQLSSFEESRPSAVDHEILIRLPIDKVAAIKNDARFIEGYFCSDVTFLRARSKTFSGFGSKNMRHLNYAVQNKEKLARISMREKERRARLVKAFSVDINSTMLSNINPQDVLEERKSLSDIFGIEEYFIVSRHGPQQGFSKNNTSDLRHLGTNPGSTKEITLFGNSEIQNKKNQDVMTRNGFQRKYCSLRRAGIDPATVLSRSAYKSQSLQQMTQGTVPNNFQTDRASEQRLGEDFHKMIESELKLPENYSSIIRRKRSKHHESLDVIITVTDRIFKSLGRSNVVDIVIFAKDKDRRKIDYHIVSINIQELEKKKRKQDSCDEIKNYEIMCNRSRNNRLIIKAANQSNLDSVYNITHSEVSPHERISSFEIKGFLNAAVPKKGSKYLVSPSASRLIGKNQSYMYRSKPSFPDITFDNTKFYNIIPVARTESGSSVSIYTENTVNSNSVGSVTIFLSDIPEDSLGCNIVKRNLTKREKEFKIIKNLRQVVRSGDQDALLDLADQRSIFFKLSDVGETFKFVDEDVENGETYEYKALLYRKNGSPELSLNSFETMYEERSGIVNIKIRQSGSKKKIHNPSRMVYEFTVDVNEDPIDKLFNSLDRNSYDLFSEDLKQIKESISKNVSCVVKLANISTGEVLELGKFVVDSKRRNFKVEFNIDDVKSPHILIVEPRVASTSYAVDNLLDKMFNLPSIQTKMPISTFSRNLNVLNRKKRNARPESKLLSSVSVSKYTSKSVRFFSLILDPVSRFNLEREDFYYEGATGDISVYSVYDPENNEASTPLIFTGMSDLSKLVDKNNQRYSKKAVVNLRCDEDEAFVDFYAFYTRSSGDMTFHGMMSPDSLTSKKDYYSYYFDLSEELGVVEVFYVCVLKNGTVSPATNLVSLVCSHNSVRKLK